MTTTIKPTAHALRATIYRERVIDADGRPVNDNTPDPGAWDKADALPSTVTPSVSGWLEVQGTMEGDETGELLAGAIDDGETYAAGDLVRAVFWPDASVSAIPGDPLLRMGDVLQVSVADDEPELLLGYMVVARHNDVPMLLTKSGELVLALVENSAVALAGA